jgi:hypothetical protein
MQLKFQFFWSTTPCRWANINGRFRTASFFHLQSRQRREDGGRKLLQNICNYLPIHMTSYCRRSQFSAAALWENSGFIMRPTEVVEKRELGCPKASREESMAPYTISYTYVVHRPKTNMFSSMPLQQTKTTLKQIMACVHPCTGTEALYRPYGQ